MKHSRQRSIELENAPMSPREKQVIARYNAQRRGVDTSILCYAPFVGMYFGQNGDMTACCYNRKLVFGKYPETSIREAWSGGNTERLRGRLAENDLSLGCGNCQEEMNCGRFNGSRMSFYDEYAGKEGKPNANGSQPPPFKPGKAGFPRVFEFELRNTCNLECVMCYGTFSSAIRRNREKLPPFRSPYDLAFVEEVVEFFPHLTDMKFLGGEPMLIDLYHRIWEKAALLKPELRMHITTNANVLPAAVKKTLEKLNVGMVVSLDSLDAAKYAKIRKNARLGATLENIKYFADLAREKGTFITLAVCPMTCNWEEIPELVRFADRQGMNIFFNVVWGPERFSLRFLAAEELARILDHYAGVELPGDTPLQAANRGAFEDFAALCRCWHDEARAPGGRLSKGDLFRFLQEAVRNGIGGCGLAGEIAAALLDDMAAEFTGEPLEDFPRSEQRGQSGLLELAREYGHEAFGLAYLDLALKIREMVPGTDERFEEKINAVSGDLRASADQETFVVTMAQLGMLTCLDMIERS